MKKMVKILALAMACTIIFTACNRKEENNVQTNTSTNQNTNVQQTSKPAETPNKTENKTEETPKVDPKAEILEKAKADPEAMLAVMNSVVETYRSGVLPEYYEAYPAKVSYPDLSSAENLRLEKGSDDCDVYVNVKVGEQNMCVSLRYVEAENPWLVVRTVFSGVKG